MRGRVRALLARGDFSGRAGETLLIAGARLASRSARLLLVGLGSKAQFSRRAWRRALAAPSPRWPHPHRLGRAGARAPGRARAG